ncbi:MAG TPA: adenosylcobinamide-GDP ribazoletransferase [Stellaceae bacterium]|nr:adenosylcobinamide-GDP ribazoletransferase [Stellaceae bacterium]
MAEQKQHSAPLAEELLLIRAALRYFTGLPWPGGVSFSQERLDRSIRYLPLVGILVGLATGAAYLLAAVLWPAPVAVAVAMAAGAALTGGFHEDGLADFCDGFFVARDREATLEIMKDPRLGSHGVLGLVLALILRFAALASLAQYRVFPALLAAHAFSRLLTLAAMRGLPYARSDGGAPKPATVSLGTAGMVVAGACGLLPLLLVWRGAVPAALAASAVALALAWLCRRRIGGYTGDCLGAIQQASEIAFYLGVLA